MLLAARQYRHDLTGFNLIKILLKHPVASQIQFVASNTAR